ncbi:MAG: hypothetical protein Rhob2KO_29500 [Rhodopirellula baltica]
MGTLSKSGKFLRQPTNGYEYEGLEADVLKAILKEIDNEIASSTDHAKLQGVYHAGSWPEILDYPNSGDCDLVIAQISFTSDRTKDYDLMFSAPYFVPVRQVLLQLSDSRSCVFANPNAARIGCTKGTTASKVLGHLVDQGMEIEIKTFQNLPSSRAALGEGQCDAILLDASYVPKSTEDDQVVCYAIEGFLEKMDVPFNLRNQQYVVGVSKREPSLLAAINRAIVGLYKAGEDGKSDIQDSINRYGLEEPQCQDCK